MGDGRKEAFRVDFDRRLRLEFNGAKVTSDAGLMVYRELDEVAALTDTLAAQLFDFRTGRQTDALFFMDEITPLRADQ